MAGSGSSGKVSLASFIFIFRLVSGHLPPQAEDVPLRLFPLDAVLFAERAHGGDALRLRRIGLPRFRPPAPSPRLRPPQRQEVHRVVVAAMRDDFDGAGSDCRFALFGIGGVLRRVDARMSGGVDGSGLLADPVVKVEVVAVIFCAESLRERAVFLVAKVESESQDCIS